MGWQVRGDKENAGERTAFARSLRKGKVPLVNWVEGAAKQADVHAKCERKPLMVRVRR